jgi:hypothetical protein
LSRRVKTAVSPSRISSPREIPSICFESGIYASRQLKNVKNPPSRLASRICDRQQTLMNPALTIKQNFAPPPA